MTITGLWQESPEFAGTLAGVPVSPALRERSDAIHRARRGVIGETPVKDTTADEFWKALLEAQVWVGERKNTPALGGGQTTNSDGLSYGLTAASAAWTPCRAVATCS